jgi:hypothetical protein
MRTLRAVALAQEGRDHEARAIAREIEVASGGDRPGEYAFALATIYAGLGDSERSLHWLETGVRGHSMFPLQSRDPLLTPVQSAPRFVALLRSLKMTE